MIHFYIFSQKWFYLLAEKLREIKCNTVVNIQKHTIFKKYFRTCVFVVLASFVEPGPTLSENIFAIKC